jgi:hypothetical protein
MDQVVDQLRLRARQLDQLSPIGPCSAPVERLAPLTGYLRQAPAPLASNDDQVRLDV